MTEKLRVLVAEGAPGRAASALRELFPDGQGSMELTEVSDDVETGPRTPGLTMRKSEEETKTAIKVKER